MDQNAAMMQAAYQAGTLPIQQPTMLPTYNLAHEEQAASGVAAGLGAAATIPGMLVTVPTIGSMVLPQRIANSTLFHTLASPFDPVSAVTLSWRGGAVNQAAWNSMTLRQQAGNMFARSGTALRAAAPAIAIGTLAYMSAQQAADQAAEGARDYVATRQLLRELPMMGFGPNSILNPGIPAGGFNYSPQSISSLNQDLRGIGVAHGLDIGQTRNLVSDLGSSGLITASSNPKQVAERLKKTLADLKQVSEITQSTLDEALQTYQALDSFGLRGHSQRMTVLNQASALSSMTGRPLTQVMGTAQLALGLGQQMGVSPLDSIGMGMRAMATGAMLEQSGGLSSRYLNRVGGYDGVVGRMLELQMGLGQSQGALNMMAAAYNPDGSLTGRGDYGSRRREANAHRFFNEVDPYQIESMREETRVRAPAMLMSRVASIQERYSHDPARANREQYRYLASMGIEDPQEQLAFLEFTRQQSTADFQIARQSVTDRMTMMTAAAPERAAGLSDRLSRDASTLSRRLDAIQKELGRAFNDLGEGLQRAAERVTRRISSSSYAASYYTPSSSGVTTADLSAYATSVLNGQVDLYGGNLLSDTYSMMNRHADALFRGMASNLGMSGITRQQSRDMLRSPFERAYVSTMIDFPRAMGRIVPGAMGFDSVVDPGGLSRAAGYARRAGAADTGSASLGRTARGPVSVDDLFTRMAAERGMVFDPVTQSLITEQDAREDAERLLSVAGVRERIAETAQQIRGEMSGQGESYTLANEIGNFGLLVADTLTLGALGTGWSATRLAATGDINESRLYRGQSHYVASLAMGKGLGDEFVYQAQSMAAPFARMGRALTRYLGVETPEAQLTAAGQRLFQGNDTPEARAAMNRFAAAAFNGRSFADLDIRERTALRASLRAESAGADFAVLGGPAILDGTEGMLAGVMTGVARDLAVSSIFVQEDEARAVEIQAQRDAARRNQAMFSAVEERARLLREEMSIAAEENRLQQQLARDRRNQVGTTQEDYAYGAITNRAMLRPAAQRQATLERLQARRQELNERMGASATSGILANAGISDLEVLNLSQVMQGYNPTMGTRSEYLRQFANEGYGRNRRFLRGSLDYLDANDMASQRSRDAFLTGRVSLPDRMGISDLDGSTQAALMEAMSAFRIEAEAQEFMPGSGQTDMGIALFEHAFSMQRSDDPTQQTASRAAMGVLGGYIRASGGLDQFLASSGLTGERARFARDAMGMVPAGLSALSGQELLTTLGSLNTLVGGSVRGGTRGDELVQAEEAFRAAREMEIATEFHNASQEQAYRNIEQMRAADDQSTRDYLRMLGASQGGMDGVDLSSNIYEGDNQRSILTALSRRRESLMNAAASGSPEQRRRAEMDLRELEYREMLLGGDRENARENITHYALNRMFDGDSFNASVVEEIIGRIGASPESARGIQALGQTLTSGNAGDIRRLLQDDGMFERVRGALGPGMEGSSREEVLRALTTGGRGGEAARQIIERILASGPLAESTEQDRNLQRDSQQAMIRVRDLLEGMTTTAVPTSLPALRVTSSFGSFADDPSGP
jgi:hypothetical protein